MDLSNILLHIITLTVHLSVLVLFGYIVHPAQKRHNLREFHPPRSASHQFS